MMLIGWLPSLAHDFEVDGIYYNNLNSNEVEVTYLGMYYYAYEEYVGDIVIPSSVYYNGISYIVTRIGQFAFSGCSSLTNIEIPNNVTSIGDYAFRDCSSLTNIEIPNNVTSIGEYAFEDCFGLTSAVIGNSVTSIGDSAFDECSSLTSVIIGNSVTSIGDYAFCNCIGLTSIEIPNSVTSIGGGAFLGCSSLTSIEIPNSVTRIGSSAFRDCSGLTSAVIGNSVTSIGDSAFLVCSSLTSVIIGNSVTSIGDCAFCNCIGLTSIEIPNSVTSIGGGAFLGCSSLTSIEIPNSVTSIRNNAFYGCSSLTSATIGNSVTSIGDSAFDECTSLIDIVIPNSVTSIGERAFYSCTSMIDIVIPNSVTSIRDCTFYNCSSLTSIEIPNNITYIGQYAFSNCSSLTKITCLTTNPPTISENTFYNKSATLYVPNGCATAYINAYYWNKFTIKEIPTLAESIILDKDNVTIIVPNSETLVATILPELTTDKSVIWSSSDESVAIVNEEGVITAVSSGQVVITATTIDGSNLSATCNVNIIQLAESITLDEVDVKLEVSETMSLTATILPETTSDKNVTWSSSNESVAVVDENGVVTAISIGEAIITATTVDSSNLSATCKVIVKPTLATSITLDYSEYKIVEKSDFQLVATVLPELTTCKDVVWSSSDMWVASVDGNGLVRAYSVGEAIITASTTDGSNLSASCKVTVLTSLAESITLDYTEVSLRATETATLVATVLPETTSNKGVEWSSSDESVATVSKKGIVTAISVGEAIITATTVDGTDLSATCKVMVVPTLAESVVLNLNEVSLEATETATLVATVLPELTTDKSVEWSSSNESVAAIDANGLVTAITVGEAIITATTADGSNLSASCKVTVVPTLAETITLDKTEISFEATETATLVAIVLPELATDKSVEWSSSNESVATIDANGLVTAIAVGEAIITVTTVDGSNLSATCKVTVVPTLAETITLDKTEISLEATETATLVATVLPELTTDKSVEWSSSNESVATIDAKGLVTAIAVGEAIITATTTDGTNLSASCKVTVVPTLAESITLDKTEISLEATETATLVATVLPELATDKSVEWSSSIESVAIVDANGVVTAISVGEAIITATTTDGSGVTATCNVTVIPTLAVSIELDQTEASVEEKSDLQLIATILPEHTTNKEVAWSSSDKWIASVDNYGLVTMYSVGEVIITATTTDGSNLSTTCRINVYSGIEGVNGNDVIVATVGDNIVVKNAKLGSVVNVYASNGALIASEEATDGSVVVEAPVKSVYVVKVGKQTIKVII